MAPVYRRDPDASRAVTGPTHAIPSHRGIAAGAQPHASSRIADLSMPRFAPVPLIDEGELADAISADATPWPGIRAAECSRRGRPLRLTRPGRVRRPTRMRRPSDPAHGDPCVQRDASHRGPAGSAGGARRSMRLARELRGDRSSVKRARTRMIARRPAPPMHAAAHGIRERSRTACIIAAGYVDADPPHRVRPQAGRALPADRQRLALFVAGGRLQADARALVELRRSSGHPRR